MAKNDVSLTISANAGSAISEINKVKSSVEQAAGAVSQAANPINKFGEQVKSLGRTSASVAQEFDKVTQATNSIASAANRTSAVNRKHQDTIRKLGGAYRSTRMAVQNFSFQIQDIAVQLTMGTNAALVLAQQLPQLLSGFGVFGAILGGVTAVIAGLGMAFIAARRDAESFSSSLFQLSVDAENLNRVFEDADALIKTFGGRVETAANVGKRLAIQDALGELSKSLGLIEEKSFWDFFNTDSPFFTALRLFANRNDEATASLIKENDAVSSLNRGLENLSKKFNISKDDALSFTRQLAEVIKNPTRKGIDDLVKTIDGFGLSGEGFGGIINALSDLRVIAEKLDETGVDKTLEKLDEKFKKAVERQEEAKKRLDEAEKNRQDQLIKRSSGSIDNINLEIAALAERIRLTDQGKSKAEIEATVQRELAIARYQASIAGIKDEAKRKALMDNFIASLDIRLSLQKKINEQQEKEKEQNLVLQDRVKLAQRLVELTKQAQALSNIPPATPMPRPRGIGDDGTVDLTDPSGVAAGFNQQAESIKRARDPLYAYLKDMEVLRKNVQEGTDTFNIMESEITKTFETAVSKLTPMQEEVQKLSLSIAEDLGSSLANVVTGAQSAEDAMKQFVARAIQDLIKLALKMDEINNKQINVGSGGGGGGNIISTIIKGISSLAGSASGGMTDDQAMIGQRAKGGPVMGGRTYLVGEKGPELFTAPKSGHIVPNNQLGGGTVVNQTFQISTGVSQTVRAELVSLLPSIKEQTVAAVANQKTRGGARGSRL